MDVSTKKSVSKIRKNLEIEHLNILLCSIQEEEEDLGKESGMDDLERQISSKAQLNAVGVSRRRGWGTQQGQTPLVNE